MDSAPTTSRLLYGLDDRPPRWKATILALQHVLTMFGSTVSIPLLFGPAMGMSTEQIGLLLDNLIPGTAIQRGLDDPGILVPKAGDVAVESNRGESP